MRALIAAIAIPVLCGIGFAQTANDNKPRQRPDEADCLFHHQAGPGAKFLKYCGAANGNVVQLETPFGREHISSSIPIPGEGYRLSNDGTGYYDYNNQDSGNWPLVASTSSVKITMTLKNNTPVARSVNSLRCVKVNADGQELNNFDGTQNSAMACNSIGSGAHPFGLLLQNVGASPFPLNYNGFAQGTRLGDKHRRLAGHGVRGSDGRE